MRCREQMKQRCALSSLTCVVMEAWAYFDDFFFYADLTFAVLFTCSGM